MIDVVVGVFRIGLITLAVIMVIEGLFDGRRESDPRQRRWLYFRAAWGAIAAVVFVVAWPL